MSGDALAVGASGAGHRRDRLATAALVAVVVLPVLAAGARMAIDGWYPTFDDAVITQRAFDVFSRNSPIVGQFSLAGSSGQSTHSPGPMLFWWLAVPARIGPTWVMPLWAAASNALCFAGVILLARRRGGLALATVVALGSLIVLRALGPATMAEIWNPWTGLAPLLLLAFLAWSILDGERWWLPVAVLVGSFTIQGHLSVLFPSLALLTVAVVGGWGPLIVARWRVGPRADHPEGATVGRTPAPVADPFEANASVAPGPDDGRLRPLIWAVVVGLACWVIPFYEELTRNPGNLTLLARSSGEEGGRGGLSAVRAAVWHSVGAPPIWLRGEQDPLAFATRSFGPVGWAQAVNVVAIAGLGLWLFLLARRRGDRMLAAALIVAGALGVGMVATAATIPLDRGLVAGYTFRWFVIGSAFCWFAVGLGVVRCWIVPAWRARQPGDPQPRGGRVLGRLVPIVPAARTFLAVSLASILVVAASFLPWRDQFAFSYQPGERLAHLMLDNTEPGGTYLVAQSGQWDLGFTPVVALALRTHGRHPVVSGTRISALGEQYAPRGERCNGRVVLQGPGDPRAADVSWLAEFEVADSGYLPDVMVVGIAPDTSPGGLC